MGFIANAAAAIGLSASWRGLRCPHRLLMLVLELTLRWAADDGGGGQALCAKLRERGKTDTTGDDNRCCGLSIGPFSGSSSGSMWCCKVLSRGYGRHLHGIHGKAQASSMRTRCKVRCSSATTSSSVGASLRRCGRGEPEARL